MTEPAVLVSNLTKAFALPFMRRGVVGVRDLNLRVQPGEIYGLLGPNGSGKSTTFKVILGLISPTRGKAEIFGRDSALVSSRAEVGFLPENPYFPKYLSAAETLRFYGKLCGLRGKALEARISDLLEQVGLTSARDRRLSGYSKGMLQRVGLAQALIHDPRLVVLDEPTASVDPVGSREIRDLILRLRDRGTTVLLSSHLLGQVQEVCDRVGILANGVLVREGRLHDLLAINRQTELLLENATPELVDQIRDLARTSGAQLVAERVSQTTLEQVFLQETAAEAQSNLGDGVDKAGIVPENDFVAPAMHAGQSAYLALRYQQQEKNLCVPTSAAIVLEYFGTPIAPRELKSLTRGDLSDPAKDFSDFTITLFPDLVAGLKKRGVDWSVQTYEVNDSGFRAGLEAVKRSLDSGHPVLIDTQLFGGHTFVVAGYDETRQRLIIVDPSIPKPGLRLLSYADVERVWNSSGAGFDTRAAVFTSRK